MQDLFCQPICLFVLVPETTQRCHLQPHVSFFFFCHRSGQRRHSADDEGLQHGEDPIVQLAEEPEPAAAGGRTDGVVRVQQELPQSQVPADL